MADAPVGHTRLVKLVRESRPRAAAGFDGDYEPIADRALALDALRAKLVEESVEYLLNPSVGELADVQQVVDALATHDPALGDDGRALGGARGKLALLRERQAKRAERGGFDYMIGMWVRTTADPRHEGEHFKDGASRE